MNIENILKGLNKVSSNRDLIFDSSRFTFNGIRSTANTGFRVSKKLFGGTLGALATVAQVPDLAKKTNKNVNFNTNNYGLEISKKFYNGE